MAGGHDGYNGDPAGSALGEVRNGGDREASDAAFLQIANVMLRNRWIIAGTAVLFAVAAVTTALLKDRTYTSSTVFMAQFDGGGSSMSGLAAQFGIRLAADRPGQSPAFYADLLRSRSILAAAVTSSYAPSGGGEGTDLLDHLDVTGPTEAVRLEKGIRALSQTLGIRTNWETGVVTFSVTTERPWLSEQVARRLLELVNEFDLTTRTSQAAAESEFVRLALEERSAELRAAEDDLERFLAENRLFTGSPALMFEHERRQREVALRHGVVLSLAQALEQARIDEVRNIPVITVVEPPVAPSLPDPRGIRMKAILALLLGAAAGLFIAFLREYFRRSAVHEPEHVREFAGLRDDILHELRYPLRLVRLGRPATRRDA